MTSRLARARFEPYKPLIDVRGSDRPITTSTTSQPAAPRWLVSLLAVGAGGTVANLYYSQPLLAAMGDSLGASEREMGAIPTLTQLGYGAAMLVLVPLGDRYERRSLIVRMTLATVAALGCVTLAPNFVMLAVASLALGVASMVPQYIVPYAAGAAAPHERGRVVGTVMSGLLIGILISRTISGFVGARFGWRAMYAAAACTMAAFALVLRVYLPRQPPEQPVALRELYGSLLQLVREQPVLRLHSLLGALSFACFSVFWSTLVFQLAALGFGSAVAGTFGLVGVVGALAAPLAGRFADGGDSRIVTVLASVAVLVSFGVFALFGSSLLGIGAGVVLLDLGVQSNQITNQARVYSLSPHMRNRLNTVYMSTYFAGGALGSAVGSFAWSIGRWPAVSATGGVLAAAMLAVIAIGYRPARA